MLVQSSFYYICFLISLLTVSIPVASQDSHYWAQQFGTRSALMSGAVVAGSDDNSMIYYNPASLAFISESNISVNANLYQISNIKINDALNNEADFASSQLGQVPLLLSGMLSNETRKWQIGYALFSPVAFTFKGSVRFDDFVNLVNDDESPGEEETIIDLSRDMRVTEIMAGVGFGKKLSDNVSIGFSHFFNVRSESFTYNFLVYSFLNDASSTLLSLTDVENVSYFNVRYILKGGVSWIIDDHWRAGLTVTTPSLNLFGSGTVSANIGADNVKFGDERVSIVGSDRQSKLKSRFRSPFSIALGATYTDPKNIIGISAAYFFSVDPYKILNAGPASFLRPESVFSEFTSDEFLIVWGGANQVINVAVGYERIISEKLSLYLSARNDQSYYKTNNLSGIQTTFTNWDIIHTSVGAIISKERSSLTVGLLPSFGSNKRFLQNGEISDEDEIFGGSRRYTEATYFSIGALLGYTYRFRKF